MTTVVDCRVPMLSPPPVPDAAAGHAALRALLQGRGLLASLAALHAELGDVFQLPFAGFNPVVLAGPDAARFVFVDARAELRWRIESDPVTRLLRHGLLVEEGGAHDRLRALMMPAFHRAVVARSADALWRSTDEVTRAWRAGESIDVVSQMRRLTLLGLTRTLFGVDIAADLPVLWQPLLRVLDFIAPGPWLLWPGLPRPGYARAVRRMDAYLLGLIGARRAAGARGDDLLSRLIDAGLSDALIRDQLLTVLIAGHDTATAALSWALHALSERPALLAQARAEVGDVLNGDPPAASDLGRLPFLERVIKETLRLYPPIHVSNRLAERDLEFAGRRIPAGTRVLFSIYLTHRHPGHWQEPERFDPERFNPSRRPPPAAFSYVPFGGGPRFCIGAALAQLELNVVLARLLQAFDFEPASRRVRLRMGATLEPEGLRLRVRPRAGRPG